MPNEKATKTAISVVASLIDHDALSACECMNIGLDTPLIGRHELGRFRAAFLAADTELIELEIRDQKRAVSAAKKSDVEITAARVAQRRILEPKLVEMILDPQPISDEAKAVHEAGLARFSSRFRVQNSS